MGASPARRADGFRKSQLRNRRLDVQDHSFELKITLEPKAKIQRILPDRPDRMIAASPG